MLISQTQHHLRNIEANARTLAALIGDGTTPSGDPALIERLRTQLVADLAVVNTELTSPAAA
jgi:hypothetical protein